MVCKPETLNTVSYIFPNATVLEVNNRKAEGTNIKQSLKDIEMSLWDVRLQMIEGLNTTNVTQIAFLENNILKASDIINQICEIEKEFDYE